MSLELFRVDPASTHSNDEPVLLWTHSASNPRRWIAQTLGIHVWILWQRWQRQAHRWWTLSYGVRPLRDTLLFSILHTLLHRLVCLATEPDRWSKCPYEWLPHSIEACVDRIALPLQRALQARQAHRVAIQYTEWCPEKEAFHLVAAPIGFMSSDIVWIYVDKSPRNHNIHHVNSSNGTATADIHSLPVFSTERAAELYDAIPLWRVVALLDKATQQPWVDTPQTLLTPEMENILQRSALDPDNPSKEDTKHAATPHTEMDSKVDRPPNESDTLEEKSLDEIADALKASVIPKDTMRSVTMVLRPFESPHAIEFTKASDILLRRRIHHWLYPVPFAARTDRISAVHRLSRSAMHRFQYLYESWLVLVFVRNEHGQRVRTDAWVVYEPCWDPETAPDDDEHWSSDDWLRRQCTRAIRLEFQEPVWSAALAAVPSGYPDGSLFRVWETAILERVQRQSLPIPAPNRIQLAIVQPHRERRMMSSLTPSPAHSSRF